MKRAPITATERRGKNRRKENTDRLLDILNRDIESLITGALENSHDIEKWSSLSNQFEPLRCWEIKGCKKKDCPAYRSKDYRCWLTVGTFCGDVAQGEFAKKYKTCFECDVFRIIHGQPIRRLYENINTIVSFIKDKTARLHQLALRDPLTGLYNRHFFNEVIEREAARCERNNEKLSLIMIDMDRFKDINDTRGHLTGDRILIEVARLVQNTVRKTDLVFRFGGDEFLVLMTSSDRKKSARMAARLRDAADRWNKSNADAFGCTISFSIGCSTRHKGGDIHSALKEADDNMYRHKKEKG